MKSNLPVANILLGAVAGFAATAPMTAVMEFLHQVPVPEKEPLPPHQITDEIAQITNTKHFIPEHHHTKLASMFTHFGYGAAGGAIYAGLVRRLTIRGWKASAAAGVLFGMSVWIGSYLGWIPAAGIMPSAKEHTARRNGLMIFAHLVWGISLALLTDHMPRAAEKSD